jgi:2-polyprenyl-3-methyl-5-hydroxy-6-metoxy-1,4-benzoquinol methylase
MMSGVESEDTSAAAARGLAERALKDELRRASASFRKKRSRHWLSTKDVVYCAFSTPGFTVRREEAQRDAGRRLEQFGLRPEDVTGKRVLDLGCNNGAMLFQLSNYGPASGLGIEYDPEKVDLARRIATFASVKGLEFRVGDLDRLEAENMGGPFDLVLCLAIEAHVRKPKHLYQLLAAVTRGKLLFEANGSTPPERVLSELTKTGFREVRHLGTCDDDIVPRNNRRPIFSAEMR